MKIAIVCCHLNFPGGTQRQALSLSRALKKKGHQVTVFTVELSAGYFPGLIEGLEIKKVAIPIPLPAVFQAWGVLGTIFQKLYRDVVYSFTVRRIASAMDKDFDIVNGHDYEAHKVSYFYRKINPHSKSVWTMNEIPFPYVPKSNFFLELGRKFYYFFRRLSGRKFFRFVDGVVTLNLFDAKWVKENFGVTATVVESGCDFERFYSPAKKLTSRRSVRLLSFGLCGSIRRFEDTLRATSILRKRGIVVRTLVLASGGNPKNGYGKYLVELVEILGLKSYVELTFDFISEGKLPQLYRETDIFVFPTYIGPPRNGYGWGLAAFEAMSAGLPVVLCRTTASVRLLKDGENAIVVDPMRPDQIASRIEELVKNPDLYYKIAKNGQKLVKNNLSWDNYALKMVGIFEQIL